MGLVSKTFGEVVTTFTRNSSGTYIDSNGLIQTAANNVPRFTYDPVTKVSQGLLLERQSTNLILQSDNWTVSPWATSDTHFANMVAGDHPQKPGSNVCYFGPNSGQTSFSNNGTQQSLTSFPIGTYTIYQDLKAIPGSVGVNTARFLPAVSDSGTGQVGGILLLSGAGGVRADNFIAGDSFSSHSLGSYPLGNGWYRCWITFTTTRVIGTFRATRVFPYSNGSAVTGDGVAGLHGTMIQLETGAFQSSYIPTTTSAATRTNEIAYRSLGSEFNLNEGTVFCDLVCTSVGLDFNSVGSLAKIPLLSITTRNSISLAVDTRVGINCVRLIRYYNDVTNLSMKSANGTAVPGSRVKIAYTYSRSTNLITLYVNGVKAGDLALAEPDLFSSGINTFLVSGLRAEQDNLYNGTIFRQTYYPRALTDSELVTLTT